MYIRRTALALLVLATPYSASAASLYLDPPTGTFGPADTFILNVRLNTDGECINAGEIKLTYPAAAIKAVDFSKGGSIFSLWAVEPKLDIEKGVVTFSGGTPGGYCGRIAGDPALTNTIGKVVFTVTNAAAGKAVVRISTDSALYLNDGLGTKVTPEVKSSAITLVPTRQTESNTWVGEVKNDNIPPEDFTVQIESTRSVFDGKYYAVFSTVDKQSGMDHFEISINGIWRNVTSPHIMDDQSLRDPVQVRAIDKAGNIREGKYVEGSAPIRVTQPGDYAALLVLALIFVIVLVVRHHLNKRTAEPTPTIDLRT